MKKMLIFASIVIGAAASRAGAIGIAVQPSQFSLHVNTAHETTIHLRVRNPSNEVAFFEVYPEEFERMILPSPTRFTLESNESRDISVNIIPSEEGVFKTKLAVVARPLVDPSLGIASGVKIPIHLEVRAPNTLRALVLAQFQEPYLVYLIGSVIALASFSFVVWKKRKRTAKPPQILIS